MVSSSLLHASAWQLEGAAAAPAIIVSLWQHWNRQQPQALVAMTA
jgi:hypothetical protein